MEDGQLGTVGRLPAVHARAGGCLENGSRGPVILLWVTLPHSSYHPHGGHHDSCSLRWDSEHRVPGGVGPGLQPPASERLCRKGQRLHLHFSISVHEGLTLTPCHRQGNRGPGRSTRVTQPVAPHLSFQPQGPHTAASWHSPVSHLGRARELSTARRVSAQDGTYFLV